MFKNFRPAFTQYLVKTVKDHLSMITLTGTYRRLMSRLLPEWRRLLASKCGNVRLLSALAMPVLSEWPASRSKAATSTRPSG